MEETYCSYEISKLLKEKGFNERTLYLYTNCDVLQHNIVYNKYKNSEMLNAYSAPTHQMAMAWLRKVHKIHIVISPTSGKGYSAILCDVGDFDDFNYIGETDYFFHTEEAVEAALKYCLENLI